jgi:hypothetical protein
MKSKKITYSHPLNGGASKEMKNGNFDKIITTIIVCSIIIILFVVGYFTGKLDKNTCDSDIYYNEWHNLYQDKTNLSSESLNYKGSYFYSSKIDNSYFLSFSNMDKNISFDINCFLDHNECTLVINNYSCYEENLDLNEEDYTNCTKYYNLKGKWSEGLF